MPGSDGGVPDLEAALKIGEEFGHPVIIKATAGGTIEDTGPLTKKRMETIDDEITATLSGLYDAAKQQLSDNREILDRITEALLERETLDTKDLAALVFVRRITDDLQGRFQLRAFGRATVGYLDVFNRQSRLSIPSGVR